MTSDPLHEEPPEAAVDELGLPVAEPPVDESGMQMLALTVLFSAASSAIAATALVRVFTVHQLLPTVVLVAGFACCVLANGAMYLDAKKAPRAKKGKVLGIVVVTALLLNFASLIVLGAVLAVRFPGTYTS